MKLHLACGGVRLPGYTNIDIQETKNVDMISDIRSLPFIENSVDQIYCCAAIEHFGRNEIDEIFLHWYKILKPNGLLRLSTTDFGAVCEEYNETKNIEKLLGLLVGGQKDTYDFHKVLFDFEYLKKKLESLGFVQVRRYDWRETEVGKMKIDDYSQAYLPHMDKEKGRLMMLNVEARKRVNGEII